MSATPSHEVSPNPLLIVPLAVPRKLVERGSQKGEGLAVFNSGKFGIYRLCEVFFFKEGHQGMVE